MSRRCCGPWGIPLLFGGLTLLLCTGAFYFASSQPDAFEKIAAHLSFADRAGSGSPSPMADYEFPWLGSPASRRIAAAVLGAAVCFLAAFGIGKFTSRRKHTIAPGSARPLE